MLTFPEFKMEHLLEPYLGAIWFLDDFLTLKCLVDLAPSIPLAMLEANSKLLMLVLDLLLELDVIVGL
jgi:hypothetical protein